MQECRRAREQSRTRKKKKKTPPGSDPDTRRLAPQIKVNAAAPSSSEYLEADLSVAGVRHAISCRFMVINKKFACFSDDFFFFIFWFPSSTSHRHQPFAQPLLCAVCSPSVRCVSLGCILILVARALGHRWRRRRFGDGFRHWNQIGWLSDRAGVCVGRYFGARGRRSVAECQGGCRPCRCRRWFSWKRGCG